MGLMCVCDSANVTTRHSWRHRSPFTIDVKWFLFGSLHKALCMSAFVLMHELSIIRTPTVVVAEFKLVQVDMYRQRLKERQRRKLIVREFGLLQSACTAGIGSGVVPNNNSSSKKTPNKKKSSVSLSSSSLSSTSSSSSSLSKDEK